MAKNQIGVKNHLFDIATTIFNENIFIGNQTTNWKNQAESNSENYHQELHSKK